MDPARKCDECIIRPEHDEYIVRPERSEAKSKDIRGDHLRAGCFDCRSARRPFVVSVKEAGIRPATRTGERRCDAW
jgi:hypothetical protein